MMGRVVDLSGERFGKLVAVAVTGDARRGAYWQCVCDCGNTKQVRSGNLRRGSVKSCGCLLGKLTPEERRARAAESSRRYRERNRDIVLERDREHARRRRETDPEGHREAQRRWRAVNPERSRELVNAAKRRQRDKDPDRFLAEARRRAAAWVAANPERRRAISHRHTLKEYGLTPEAYDALVAAQNSRCAICGAASSGRKADRRLSIDHCHDTGVVRGLLCNFCNTMLGYAKDSAARLRAAADYLERLPVRSVRDLESNP